MSARFVLTPRLSEAMSRGLALAGDASDQGVALAAATREGTIALSDVVALSRSLQSCIVRFGAPADFSFYELAPPPPC